MKEQLIIIGSGWLGRPLAEHLARLNYYVSATTTSLNNLKTPLVGASLVLLNTEHKQQALAQLRRIAPTTMIIAIPPSRTNNDYFKTLTVLSDLAIEGNIKRVLFISSSSVWGSSTGIITEKSPTSPTSDSATAMDKFEHYLHNQENFDACTLRLTGLFNQQRNPGRFLAGRENVANPNAPVNMIHQQDCIGLISAILQQQQWQPVYIGCAPSHPTRHVFYTASALALGLIAPKFIPSGGENAKCIDSSATARQLGYHYVFSDIMNCGDKD